jgi:amidase
VSDVLPLSPQLRALAAGELTSAALAATLVERILAREVAVQALAAFDPARAVRLAAEADALPRDDTRPLAGLPVGVKDIIDTADLPTCRGSRAFEDRRPMRDAAVVERLELAGAIVLAKAETTELAFMHPARTRNPWNLAHTPGGSSAGSAAGVAAGFFPVALGTQTNGSVIRPAAFCGVVGFKPTAGLLPMGGVMAFSETLDQLGTFARCIADVAWFTAPLAAGESITPRVSVPARAPRIGLLARYPWNAPDAAGAAHLDAVAARLAAAGATVTAVDLPAAVKDTRAVHRTIMLFEALRQHGELLDYAPGLLGAQTYAGLVEARDVAAADYAAALAARGAIAERTLECFEPFDVIASLPAPGAAPGSLELTGDPSFCTLWSLTGCPALTLPSGLSAHGLPFGLQLAAAPGADDALLAAAAWCERVLAFDAAPG